MDIQPQTQQSQSISDDQELAKVLAGVSGETEEVADTAHENPTPIVPSTPMPSAPQAPVDTSEDEIPAPTMAELETPLMPPMPSTPVNSSLDSIKQQALGELRPLVDKLDVSAEEKFDTYLLLIRSTDDKDLVAPAHAAAKSIADEARRAQALLDIIKEIDFLSNPQTN